MITWIHKMFKLLDKNTWNYITVCKQTIIIKYELNLKTVVYKLLDLKRVTQLLLINDSNIIYLKLYYCF